MSKSNSNIMSHNIYQFQDDLRKAQKQLKDLKKKMGEMELSHNQQIKRKDDELTELNSIITRETQLFQEKDMELQV